MNISSELLYHFLSERFTVSRHGRGNRCERLPLPIFYLRGMTLQPGKAYVARTQDMPQVCHVNCLFLCSGNRPTQAWSYWQGEVFYISNKDVDLFNLFNVTIEFFDTVTGWDRKMQALLEEHADIEELVRASIPLFENSITVTDYDLRVLADCIDIETNGARRIVINREFNRVPDKISLSLTDVYKKNIQMREPFFHKGQREDPEGLNYCVNLFLGDNYIGTCSLRNRLRPLCERDYILFNQFSEYIRRALSVQSRTSPNQLITIKTIFNDLLQGFPVSREDSGWALNLLHRNMELQGIRFGGWQCVAIRSANRGKTLPEGYLCAALENMLPRSTVVAHDGMLVCCRVVLMDEEPDAALKEKLEPYLRDMNFKAGASVPFDDIFEARDYYLQARAMLDTGVGYAASQRLFLFEENILRYMLQKCTGEFDAGAVMTPGLCKLSAAEGGIDYWDTLRRYLDNECNASRTAQEMHLHRSSLLPRLEKIKALVKLDTPEQRLYLRMCIALQELQKE